MWFRDTQGVSGREHLGRTDFWSRLSNPKMEKLNNLFSVGALTTPTFLLLLIPPGFPMVVLAFLFHKTAFFQKYLTQSSALVLNRTAYKPSSFFPPSSLLSLPMCLFPKLQSVWNSYIFIIDCACKSFTGAWRWFDVCSYSVLFHWSINKASRENTSWKLFLDVNL